MKTKHNFETGDSIEHNGRTGTVALRARTRKADLVQIEWDDGERQEGSHSKLWMCNNLTRQEPTE